MPMLQPTVTIADTVLADTWTDTAPVALAPLTITKRLSDLWSIPEPSQLQFAIIDTTGAWLSSSHHGDPITVTLPDGTIIWAGNVTDVRLTRITVHGTPYWQVDITGVDKLAKAAATTTIGPTFTGSVLAGNLQWVIFGPDAPATVQLLPDCQTRLDFPVTQTEEPDQVGYDIGDIVPVLNVIAGIYAYSGNLPAYDATTDAIIPVPAGGPIGNGDSPTSTIDAAVMELPSGTTTTRPDPATEADTLKITGCHWGTRRVDNAGGSNVSTYSVEEHVISEIDISGGVKTGKTIDYHVHGNFTNGTGRDSRGDHFMNDVVLAVLYQKARFNRGNAPLPPIRVRPDQQPDYWNTTGRQTMLKQLLNTWCGTAFWTTSPNIYQSLGSTRSSRFMLQRGTLTWTSTGWDLQFTPIALQE